MRRGAGGRGHERRFEGKARVGGEHETGEDKPPLLHKEALSMA